MVLTPIRNQRVSQERRETCPPSFRHLWALGKPWYTAAVAWGWGGTTARSTWEGPSLTYDNSCMGWRRCGGGLRPPKVLGRRLVWPATLVRMLKTWRHPSTASSTQTACPAGDGSYMSWRQRTEFLLQHHHGIILVARNNDLERHANAHVWRQLSAGGIIRAWKGHVMVEYLNKFATIPL